MKMMSRASFLKLAAGAAALLLAGCQGAGGGGGAASASGSIKIAALYPTSGPLALLGEESWRGTKLAADEINAAGGIDGRKIELVRADVPDVNAASSEARRLFDQQQLDLAVGTYSSSLALAASEVYARGGGTYVELGAVTVDFNKRGYKSVLRTNPNAANMATAQLDFIKNWVEPQLKKTPDQLKVLIVHEDSAYGSSLARSFTTLAAADGIKNVSAEPYKSTSTDLSSTVLHIGQAKPDVVVAVSYASDAILLGRQMAENGVSVPVFLGSGGGHTLQSFGKTLGKDANYVFDADFTQYHVNKKATPGIDDFVAAYKKAYNSDPASGHSLANYAGMKIVAEILKKTKGDTSSDAVMKAAATIDMPVGSTATGWGVKFDETGQNTRAADYIMQWQNGVLETVWPKNMASADPVLKK